MSNFLPDGMRNNFSREGWHGNAPSSVPSPPAQGLPAQCWISSPVRTSWTNDRAKMPSPVQDDFDSGKITHFAAWATPIFDLKPILRSFTANGKSGRNDNTRRAVAVGVGGGTGSGGKMFAQISLHSVDNDFVNTSNFDDVVVRSFERAHVSDPGKVGRISQVQDITTNFALDGNKYIILAFTPFGEGTPVRYWQQVIWFSKKQVAGNPVPFAIQGVLY